MQHIQIAAHRLPADGTGIRAVVFFDFDAGHKAGFRLAWQFCGRNPHVGHDFVFLCPLSGPNFAARKLEKGEGSTPFQASRRGARSADMSLKSKEKLQSFLRGYAIPLPSCGPDARPSL